MWRKTRWQNYEYKKKLGSRHPIRGKSPQGRQWQVVISPQTIQTSQGFVQPFIFAWHLLSMAVQKDVVDIDAVLVGYGDNAVSLFYSFLCCNSAPHKTSQQGFTLIELMIALKVFAMLALAGWQIMDSLTKVVSAATNIKNHYHSLIMFILQLSQDLAQTSNRWRCQSCQRLTIIRHRPIVPL